MKTGLLGTRVRNPRANNGAECYQSFTHGTHSGHVYYFKFPSHTHQDELIKIWVYGLLNSYLIRPCVGLSVNGTAEQRHIVSAVVGPPPVADSSNICVCH